MRRRVRFALVASLALAGGCSVVLGIDGDYVEGAGEADADANTSTGHVSDGACLPGESCAGGGERCPCPCPCEGGVEECPGENDVCLDERCEACGG